MGINYLGLAIPAIIIFLRIRESREKSRKAKQQDGSMDAEVNPTGVLDATAAQTPESEGDLSPELLTATNLDCDEHQRCRVIEGRLQDEISRLNTENERLQKSLRNKADSFVVKRTCRVTVKNTKAKTTLARGDRIIVLRKTLKADASPKPTPE